MGLAHILQSRSVTPRFHSIKHSLMKKVSLQWATGSSHPKLRLCKPVCKRRFPCDLAIQRSHRHFSPLHPLGVVSSSPILQEKTPHKVESILGGSSGARSPLATLEKRLWKPVFKSLFSSKLPLAVFPTTPFWRVADSISNWLCQLKTAREGRFLNGGSSGARTHDTLLKRQVL